jgi:hypothetical protein
LRPSEARHDRKRACARCQTQKSTAGKFHHVRAPGSALIARDEGDQPRLSFLPQMTKLTRDQVFIKHGISNQTIVLRKTHQTIDGFVTLQAQIIAYIDNFKLLMIVTLAAIPLLIAFKKAPDSGGDDHTLVVE